MTLGTIERYISSKIASIYDTAEANNIASWVVEEVTKTRRLDRVMEPNTPISEAQSQRIEEIIKALQSSQPIQHILGYAYFFGEQFFVNEHTLIPRPETEQLVDLIISTYEHVRQEPLKILDIGTGTGCIPIMLKKHFSNAAITSVDISSDALAVAQKNASFHQVEINYQLVDILNENQHSLLGTYDIIVSNPPYILNEEAAEMTTQVMDFEPHQALFVTNNDPLQFYSAILKFAQSHLSLTGKIFFEINRAFGKETLAAAEKLGYKAQLFKDFQENDRMVVVEKGE